MSLIPLPSSTYKTVKPYRLRIILRIPKVSIKYLDPAGLGCSQKQHGLNRFISAVATMSFCN
ncbi:hypothetical protein YC2023_076019 [Brassica napus]